MCDATVQFQGFMPYLQEVRPQRCLFCDNAHVMGFLLSEMLMFENKSVLRKTMNEKIYVNCPICFELVKIGYVRVRLTLIIVFNTIIKIIE